MKMEGEGVEVVSGVRGMNSVQKRGNLTQIWRNEKWVNFQGDREKEVRT